MSVWKRDEENSNVLNPIGISRIKEVEQQLDVLLPTLYVEMILEQNGGEIIYNACPSPVPTVWGEDFVKVDSIMGIEEDGGILVSDQYINEWDMPKNLILLNGDGHTWIALDYRKNKEIPPVIFIDNEREQIIELALNFESFIKKIITVEESGFDVKVEIEDMPTYSENEIIKEIKTTDLIKLIDIIGMMSYSYNQKFTFEQYEKLLCHSESEVRIAIAYQLYNLLMLNEVTEIKNFRELVRCLSKDNDSQVTSYYDFINEELKNRFA